MQSNIFSAKCFTATYKGRTNQLRTTIGISPYMDSEGNVLGSNRSRELRDYAVWDTGATSTCVSGAKAKELNLIQTGIQEIHTPAGRCIKPVYSANVFLPNGIWFKNIPVIEAELTGFDVLIGMDIIVQGDFVVSNHDGITRLTYRVPSMHGYDFMKSQYLTEVKTGINTGRNQPCPCGSGKKYKNCCGKQTG